MGGAEASRTRRPGGGFSAWRSLGPPRLVGASARRRRPQASRRRLTSAVGAPSLSQARRLRALAAAPLKPARPPPRPTPAPVCVASFDSHDSRLRRPVTGALDVRSRPTPTPVCVASQQTDSPCRSLCRSPRARRACSQTEARRQGLMSALPGRQGLICARSHDTPVLRLLASAHEHGRRVRLCGTARLGPARTRFLGPTRALQARQAPCRIAGPGPIPPRDARPIAAPRTTRPTPSHAMVVLTPDPSRDAAASDTCPPTHHEALPPPVREWPLEYPTFDSSEKPPPRFDTASAAGGTRGDEKRDGDAARRGTSRRSETARRALGDMRHGAREAKAPYPLPRRVSRHVALPAHGVKRHKIAIG